MLLELHRPNALRIMTVEDETLLDVLDALSILTVDRDEPILPTMDDTLEDLRAVAGIEIILLEKDRQPSVGCISQALSYVYFQ